MSELDKAGEIKLKEYQSSSGRNRHSIFFEIAPLVLTVIIVLTKLTYFNLTTGVSLWSPETSYASWVQANPYVLTTTLGTILLLCGLLPLMLRIWRFVILLLLNLFITSLVVANMIHIGFYNDVISIWSYLNATMLPWVFSSIIDLLHPVYAIMYFDIIALVALTPFYWRASKNIHPLNRSYMSRLSVGLIVIGMFLTIPGIRVFMEDAGGSLTYENSPREVVSVIGLLPYHLSDVAFYADSKIRTIDQQEIEYVHQFMKDRCNQSRGQSELFGVADGSNVILISAESLHSFTIGLEIDGQAVTPRFNELVRESLYFVDFYDQTHLGTTSDGEFTALQSLYPLPVGSVASQYHNNSYFGLPAYLVEHEYTTFSAVGAPAQFWSMNKMHPQYGFQQGYYEDYYEITEQINGWLADKEFFQQTVPVLEAQTEPFMGFLLSSSNHHPFELAEEHRRLELGELETTTLGRYLQTTHYFDEALGQLLDALQLSGLLDRSVLVIYGDHKTYLGEPSDLTRLLNLTEQSEVQQRLIRQKVPLLIRLPHGANAKQYHVAGGHLDIAPTLLSLLGLSDDNCIMLGEDLTLEEDSLVVFRDGSFVDGNHYMINRFGPTVNSICYDLNTEQRIDCGLLEKQRLEALQRLLVSDLIIRGDLIPFLLADE